MNRSLLVPTDFSEVADNASKYALALARQTGISKIILFHSWQQPLVISADMVNAELVNGEIIRESSEENLKRSKAELQAAAGDSVTVESFLDYSEVTSGIEDFCKSNNVTCVVMGVTGRDLFDEKIIGSNAVTTARRIGTPIIILPASVSYGAIRKVLLLSDYRDIENTLPATPIKDLLHITGAKLYIAHVDQRGEKLDDSIVEADNRLFDRLFPEENPEFHILHEPDYIEAVNHFVKENDIDLIIAMPKKKTFWQSIFQPSRTKQLAFNGETPMLLLQPKA